MFGPASRDTDYRFGPASRHRLEDGAAVIFQSLKTLAKLYNFHTIKLLILLVFSTWTVCSILLLSLFFLLMFVIFL